jgi:RNA polymerase sigma-70 factor, ECF subfamily
MPLNQEDIIRTLLAARRRILAAAWLVVRDASASEDIFQNVTFKAMTSGARFEREADLISWAFVTTRHEALNWIRDRQSQAIVLDSELLNLLGVEWAAVGSKSDGDRVEALEACVGGLPGNDRRMLELRYQDERSCGEVASALGLKLDTVYQRLSRLHRALRECIERRLAGAFRQPSQEAS